MWALRSCSRQRTWLARWGHAYGQLKILPGLQLKSRCELPLRWQGMQWLASASDCMPHQLLLSQDDRTYVQNAPRMSVFLTPAALAAVTDDSSGDSTSLPQQENQHEKQRLDTAGSRWPESASPQLGARAEEGAGGSRRLVTRGRAALAGVRLQEAVTEPLQLDCTTRAAPDMGGWLCAGGLLLGCLKVGLHQDGVQSCAVMCCSSDDGSAGFMLWHCRAARPGASEASTGAAAALAAPPRPAASSACSCCCALECGPSPCCHAPRHGRASAHGGYARFSRQQSHTLRPPSR